MTGNRAHTGAPGKKIPTDKSWDFKLWWDTHPPPTVHERTQNDIEAYEDDCLISSTAEFPKPGKLPDQPVAAGQC